MIETIKHLTGMCGEPHLNLFTGTLILAIGIYSINKVCKKEI